MVKQITKIVLVVFSSILIFACGTGKQAELEVEVSVTLDGKPAPQAKVLLDGADSGATDSNGYFSKRIKRQPGAEVLVAVQKEATGYHIEPWKDSFVVKLPKDRAVDRYPFKVDLKATKYFTLVVTDSGEPLHGASIRIQGIEGKTNVKTDEHGEYVYNYRVLPEKGLHLRVTKKGYTTWLKTVTVKPGQRMEVSLPKKETVAKVPAAEAPVEEAVAKKPAVKAPAAEERVAKVPAAKKPAVKAPAAEERVAKVPAAKKPAVKAPVKEAVKKATISIVALTEAYGVSKGIPDVVVNIDDKPVGKTNAKGVYTYVYRGKPAKGAQLKLTAPGYIPEQWLTTINLEGKQSIERFFYPAKPEPLKVGIYGYINNTPEEDLSEILSMIEKSLSDNLSIYSSLLEVPKPKLREEMLQTSLDMETASTKGWQNTRLIRSVDMIIAGSVSKDDQGMTIETTVNFADGNAILSQINKVNKKKEIENTVKLIVNNIIDQFPFEGTIDAIEANRYRINLGKLDHRIRRGNEFKYMAADSDWSGRVKGYHEAGIVIVRENGETSSWAEIVTINEGEEINIGDKLVRRIYLEEEREVAEGSFLVLAKGGSPPDAAPLWGVNVYLNNTWVGTTRSNGTVEIPVHLYEEYDILLSRYGHRPVHETISVDEDKQVKEFFLDVATALFKVESQPSEADVFVDGVVIGKTPILDGKPVNFGFRKIKLSVGGEYRDWERVLEFNEPTIERTGENKIIFLKDYLKIGRMAEQNGDIDAAIQAYASAEKGHPDYSDARHRLAQLYMDEKNNYDSAIREFENVLSLPENQQIIYKQFAVTYTNLGHAYYEKGNQLIHQDKKAAAQNLAKAIQKLEIAKQNTRFFPTKHYEEAVHDTYYYQAISYHKLFMITKKRLLLGKANLAWREYFDFFPKKLEADSSFVKNRNAARRYWAQIKDLT
ncbi:MAG: PEGA domain-containing protein [Desulfobacterales bacterium]|nr:PEGA domain-containing protein [Desulfobacterales bacterium]